jgi:micrococcal nuclease
MKRLTIVSFMLAFLATSVSIESAHASSTTSVKVVSIVDGDTIKVRIGGKTETVRLIGIDTPETKKPGTPVQCWGVEATKATNKLLNGATVTLTMDKVAGNRDRWGRMLRYVSVKGRDVGNALIQGGHARAYAYKNQRYNKRDLYERTESVSKRENRGLWGAC